MGLIYKITNKINGHSYIGKTVQQIEDRFKGHLKSVRSNQNGLLHKAIRKYGKDNFLIEILQDNIENSELDKIEIKCIDEYEPYYNMTAGGNGGSTTHRKRWITNGIEQKYIDISDIESIPYGWKLGRICKFQDPNFQREMSNRVDRKKAGAGIKKAWDEGRVKRDNSKIGKVGDTNVQKRPEVREKIRQSALKRQHTLVTCPHCGKVGKHSVGMLTNHFDKCKYTSLDNFIEK